MALLDDVQNGMVTDVVELDRRFEEMHSQYYDYEWKWAYKAINDYYGTDLHTASVEMLKSLVCRWKDSVVGLDNMIYEDARKEFSLSAMTGFGADGDEVQMKEDFMHVRGSFFEADPFVTSVKEHIKAKSELGDRALELLAGLS